MAWKLDSGRPIYTQLVEIIRLRIITGEYPTGSYIPSVRELAAEAAVNPNTMQRALADLEREGFLETQRTSGRIVKADEETITREKNKQAQILISKCIQELQKLEIPADTIKSMWEQSISQEGEANGTHTSL